MSQQMEHDPAMISPSLREKARQFVDGLTPEESAQLRALQSRDGADPLSPSLRTKLERSVQGLTAEEATHLASLLQRAGVGAMVDADGDTRGYMRSQQQEYDTQGQVGGNLNQYTLAQIGIGFLGFVTFGVSWGTGDPPSGSP